MSVLDEARERAMTNGGGAPAEQQEAETSVFRRRVSLLHAKWTISAVLAWLLCTYTGLPWWAGVLVGLGLAFGV